MSMGISWISGMSRLKASWRARVAARNAMRSSSVASRTSQAASKMFAATTLPMETR